MNALFDRVVLWSRRWTPEVKPKIVYLKVEEEFKEFLEQPSAEEAADCILTLANYAVAAGWDLPSVLNDKMAFMESKEWIMQPNGTVRWRRG